MNQTEVKPQELILALSKGRIFEETIPLLKEAGITVLEDPETSRKLILPTNKPQVRVIIVRATSTARLTSASPARTSCRKTAIRAFISRLIYRSPNAVCQLLSETASIMKTPSGRACV